MALKQYDPLKVSIVVGVTPVSFFADGEMITVTYAEDNNSMHIGTDGQGRHVVNANRSGTVTIRLAGYSPSNAVLTGLDVANVPFPITMTDKTSLADVFFAESCKVQKVPDMVKGKEEAELEWTFNFIRGTITHTGAGQQ